MNRRAFLLLATALLACSCSKHESYPPVDDPQRTAELELFVEAIRIVQERYVDVDQVQLTRIISNSLKGVIASVDPYAEIFYTGEPAVQEIPKDVSMVEAEGPDANGTLIIRIFGFNRAMKKQFKKLASSLRKEQVLGILVDCRGAHGDNYESAAALADWFLERETVIGSLEEKQGERVQVFVSKKKPVWATNMVVVIQDNTLKGPGEFFAAALRANDRCILVGQPSSGIAVVQTPIKLTDEWTVMLSTGRVREPGGRVISGNPIIPDIIAHPEPENNENIDWTYRRGLAVLKDQHIFKDNLE